jgi:hypothetical protein
MKTLLIIALCVLAIAATAFAPAGWKWEAHNSVSSLTSDAAASVA